MLKHFNPALVAHTCTLVAHGMVRQEDQQHCEDSLDYMVSSKSSCIIAENQKQILKAFKGHIFA